MMSSERKSAGPTSVAARCTSAQRLAAVRGSRSRCLCRFSIMTMAASTMAPMAMAIPPRDMMLALIPCQPMTMKAARMAMGRLRTTTRAERTCHRKRTQTSATMTKASTSRLLEGVDGAMDEPGAVVDRHQLHPVGQASLAARPARALTAAMVSRALPPGRISTMPPTTSP